MICENCGSSLPTKGMICPHCGHILNKRQVELQKEIETENKKKGVGPTYHSDQYGVKKDFKLRDDKKSYVVAYIIIIAFLVALSVILFIVR